MANSINSKAKEYYDNDDTGGSLNSNLKDFLKQQGATGKSINTLWRDYAYGEGGTSLNTRLRNLWGTSGSLMKRWKETIGLTWDKLKAFFNFRDIEPDFLLDGSTSFSGSSQYIDCGTGLGNALGDNYAGDLTVSMWFKADVTSGDDGMFEIGNFTNSGTGDFALRMKSNTLSWMVNAVRRIDVAYTNTSSWSHVVGVYDSRGADFTKLYLNGESVGTPTGTFPSASDLDLSGLKTTIGGYYGSPYTFDGKIANVGIWNRALSASEVESIYWRGSHSELQNTELTNLVSWYDLDSTSLGSELVVNGTFDSDVSGWAQTNLTATYDSGTAVITNQETVNDEFLQAVSLDEGVGYEVSATISNYSAGTSTVVLRYDNTALTSGGSGGDRVLGTIDGNKTITATIYGTSGSEVLRFRCTGTGSATNYTIDNVSVKAIQTPDAQGSNEGNIIGATVNTDSYSGESPFKPRIQDKAAPKMAVQLADGSTTFDGADSYINCGSDSSLDNIWNGGGTLSAWIFPESDGEGDDGRIAEKRDTGNGWTFTTREQSGSSCKLRVFINFSSTNGVYTSGADVNINAWNHVAVAYDSSGAGSSYRPVIYINGSVSALSATTDSVGTADSDASEDFTIGGNKAQTRIFDGKIANVSVHSSSLTQSQIQELMFTEKYSGLSVDLKTNLVSWYDLGDTSLGSELVTNGGFDTTDVWAVVSGTWVIEDGVAKGGGGTGFLAHGLFTQGKLYSMTFTVKDYVSGSVNVSFSDGTLQGTNRTANGTYTEIGTVTANNNIYFKGTLFNGSIDDVSVKEVQATDSEGTNEGSIYGATTNTGYTHSPHGVVDPLNFGEVYSGRALSFDGTNDSVNLGVVSNYSSASGSICIWIYSHNNSTPSLQGIVTNSSTGTDQHFLGIGSSKVRYSATNSSSIFTIFADSELVENQWTHVVATRSYDGANTTTKLYINGVLQTDSDTFSGSQVANSNNILIGHLNVDRYFDGELNNLKIFNTALTQDQVRELYTKPETVLPTGVSASNLKLDLPMQEKAGSIIYDGSGNQNHGTITGATFVTGEEYGYQASLVRSNTPIIFDGSDDFVSCGNIGIRNYPFTYSAWFRTNGTTKNTICALCDADQNVVFYQFLIADTGVARINARNTADDFCDSSGTYNDGKWHHGVAVFASATDRKIYIDGVADGSDTSSVAFGSGVDEFSIGVLNRSSKADYYDDDINEVAVWDVALDADAVSALYNSGVPLLPTSDSGNYDNSDSLMGYWRNDGKPTWTDRANTGYASFDDSDDQIALSDSSALTFGTNDFTASAWVYVNDLDNKLGVLGSETNGFGLFVETDGTISSTKTNIVGEVKSTGTLSTKNWHHIAYTRVYSTGGSASLGTYYIDGVASGTTIDNNDYTVTSKYIGRIQSTNRFDGKIAGCNYFSIPLTASEISELYAIGKRTSISGHSQFSNCVGSWLMGAGTGDSTSTIQDQTSNNNDGTVSGASIIGYNDGTASGSPVEILIPEGSTEGRDNQGYYLSDTTTISNGIRLFGSEYIDVHDSEVLSFGDGIDDRPFTFECWVKADDLTSKVFFSKGVYNTDGEYLFGTTGADKLDLFLMDESVASTFQRVQTSAITSYEGQWIHVVATYDGRGGTSANDGMKLYLNGVSQTVTKSSGGTYVAMENLGSNVEIGLYNTTYSEQLIDEIRIYSKELSASEVLKNYTNGLGKHS